jgi:sec-independent protein translocase protein TatB
MDFFGIGFLEIFFIVIIALIVLGPKDMVKVGRSMGRFLRKILLAPGFMEAQRWVRNFPAQLMREAGIEEIQNELKKEAQKIKEETTVSLDGSQPALTGTIARSPALTPGQGGGKTEGSPVGEADETIETGSPASAQPESPQPSQAKEPQDIPAEWLSTPSRREARARSDNGNEYAIEWLGPPRPSGATYPPPYSAAASPDDGNADEHETGQS